MRTVAYNWQCIFQDPATHIVEAIIDLHQIILFYELIILFFLIWILCQILINFTEYTNIYSSHITEHTTLEIIWTIVPSFILVLIAIPSFGLLFMVEECINSQLTLKVSASQWYWSYTFSDYSAEFSYDSYLTTETDLVLGDFRLLEVSSNIILPIQVNIRVLVSSTDVLHSWRHTCTRL